MSLQKMSVGTTGLIPASDAYASNLIVAHSGAIEHGYSNVASLINTSGSNFPKFVPSASNQPLFSSTAKFYNTALELSSRSPGVASWLGFNNPNIPAFGTGNFCLETWVYIPTFTGLTQAALWYMTNAVDNTGFQCFLTGDSFGDPAARRGVYFVGGAGAELNYAGACLSPNTWHHIAVVRNGSASNSLKIYVDGVDNTDFRNATGNPNWTYSSTLFLAAPASETGWDAMKLQDYRIYQGTPKYTSNFTPPGAMFI